MLYSKILTVLAIFLVFLSLASVSSAATPPVQGGVPEEDGFVYTVQPGDTLVLIGRRHGLTVADIMLANALTNPDLIYSGQRLTLPLVSVSPELPSTGQTSHVVQVGESLSTIADRYGVSVGAMVLTNSLLDPNVIQPGQTLLVPAGPPTAPEALPAPFVAVKLSESFTIPGRTVVVKVTLSDPAVTLSGSFEGQPLFFQPGYDQATGQPQFWGLMPIHALAEPNLYPVILTATLSPDGPEVTTLANVTVIDGPYGRETIQLDERRGELLDPELIQLEREKLDNLWSQVSSRPYWEGPFRYPMDPGSLRITSYFGTRRNYNGSPVLTFHEGVDFGGNFGAPIYAPAAGRVVLAEQLTVRGNAVLIDHGLGLFSGYWHQSQLAATEGQTIEKGDIIGYMGDTGLVTGPHLHWEMRLNGIAVEPRQWVQQAIP